MSLAIDASSPVPVAPSSSATVGSLTTASFTPPSGAILLIMFGNGSTTGANVSCSSLTDNLGTHLTYTKQLGTTGSNSNTSVWTSSAVGTSAAMTVTATLSSSGDGGNGMILGVLVFTGAASTQAGKTATATGGTGAAPSMTFGAGTSSTSWLMGCFSDGNTGITPTTGSNQTTTFNGHSYVGNTGSGDNAWCQGNSAVGNSNLTINDTNTGFNWSATGYEVQAAASAAPLAPGVIYAQAVKRAAFY